MSRRPRLALVPGEPAGIGPELVVRAAQRDWEAQLICYGDRDTLLRAADAIGLPLRLISANDPGAAGPGHLAHVEIPTILATRFGHPEPRNARTTIGALETAAGACLQGLCDGLVTGPINKAAINDGGIAYTGTTELLAAQARGEVVMMLANDLMRVALATTHLPLRNVADAITAEGLERTLRIIHSALRNDFGIAAPRIAVLGLNPHAGEEGHLGREELDIVIPLLDRLRGEGWTLIGPLPADTGLLPAKLAEYDAVLAMYHDQGLPVLKYSGFEHAVNITLGLPYPRVAVDHGTALDLAGRGIADPSSLFAAIEACTRLAHARIARTAAA